MHKYLYANANPVMYSDPSGYMSLGETVAVSSIIGGLTSSLINVAAYLDGLCSINDFDFGDASRAAFEGFLDGMVIGAAGGLVFCGLSALCVMCPALEGIVTAFEYSAALLGSLQSIAIGYNEAAKGNYCSSAVFALIGWGSLFTLFKCLFDTTPSSDSGGTPPTDSDGASPDCSGNAASGNSNNNSIGPKFNPKGPKYQEGVDPNSLIPQKDLNTLDPQRQANAVKFGRDKAIEVDHNGIIQDGHHRVKDAIQNDRPVDVYIVY